MLTKRLVVGGFGLLTLMLYVSTPVLAGHAHKAGGCSREGEWGEGGGGKLAMSRMSGQNQLTQQISAGTAITFGKKKCGMEDLKPGSTVCVTAKKEGDSTVVTKVRETMSQ